METWEGRDGSGSTRHSEEKPAPQVSKRKREPPALEKVGPVEENGGEDSEHSEPEAAGGEDSSSESSDTGSSSTSSSGSSSSTGSEQQEHHSPFTNLFEVDEFGEYLKVACNTNEARFYLSRFARGSRGRCVLFRGRWITPNEFQAVSGRQSSKDWKRSIRLKGRCLKEYIAQGMFQEHQKSCTCRICAGEDAEHLRQEGEMALAAKRRRLSQADSFGSGTHPQSTSEPASVSTAKEVEDKVGPPPKKRRGRPPKIQRVWSPSGEVAQDVSSNDDEYKPVAHPPTQPLPQTQTPGDSEEGTPGASVIDASDFLPRRSRRSTTRKVVGHRTELGTFTRKPVVWDVEEVAEFLRLQGFADCVEPFQEAEIDGSSLFMLKEHHLLERFSMKLGPSLKLLDTISRLRHPPLV